MNEQQTEREKRMDKIRRGKRKKIAVGLMFAALFIIAVMLLVLLVQGVSAIIKGGAQTKPQDSTPQSGDASAADPAQDATVISGSYGPSASDLDAVLSPRRSYDYSKAVPEIPAVAESYFADSLMLGDSRCQGFTLYGVMNSTEILASGSVSVSSAMTKEFSFGDGSATLASRLDAKPFGSIYLSLGLNELGWQYPEVFIDEYSALIDAIRAKQPLADIYIESIIPLSAEKSASADYFSKERVAQYNALLLDMAQKKSAYYLNVQEVFIDGSGYMKAEATSDGINPARDYFDIWYDYLKTHTVSKEYYGN